MPKKPSEKEEEFIARQQLMDMKRLEAEKAKRLEETEKARRKELHFMKCPKCGMDLIEIEYKALKIDRCSSCDGVWLDAGEMDQISGMEKGSLEKLFSIFK